MSFIHIQVYRIWSVLLRPILMWVVSKASPDNPIQNIDSEDGLVAYILPKRSYLDRIILKKLCKKNQLPIPDYDLDPRKKNSASVLFLRDPGMLKSRFTKKSKNALLSLIELQKKYPDRKIQLVPVSPFWGKNPGRGERSLWKLLFTDDENAGWLQRIFIVLIQGRNNVVYFAESLTFDQIAEGEGDIERIAEKTRRTLRVHFRRQRNTVLGKKLYIREDVIEGVANGQLVRAAVENEISSKLGKGNSRSLETRARRYVRELAADQTYSMIRAFEVLLGRLWNKLFDGVEIRNLENVRTLAEQNYEIVYVPTHRSHLDYLLTSYTIYESGMPSPHIAAGINLNFWPMGWFLRRAGAFFIRRSFRGDRLYTAVVNEYVHYLLTKGYPLTFFPEGGRSRTGKLLPLKTGMLAMVVHSFLRSSKRPIALVPTYLGYDKVMEVRSYMSELSGSRKKKESIFALFQARKLLKAYYGKAYVSYGKPIILSEFLDENQPTWRELDGQLDRPSWMPTIVQSLANRLSTGMNETSVVTPISLVSLSLLASWQKALPRSAVIDFARMVLELQKRLPYSTEISLPEGDSETILKDASLLEMHSEFKHAGGSVLHLSERESILISYYRNNIIHLFAIPSLIARFFRHQDRVSISEITNGCLEIYPFLKEEFYLRWNETEIVDVIAEYSASLIEIGVLTKDGDYLVRPEKGIEHGDNLNILGNSLGLTFERYTITAALLAQHSEAGFVDSDLFELQCHKMAQRLAILNGVNNPEFADKKFVSKHVQLLKKKGLLTPSDGGKLIIDPRVSKLAKSSTKLLSYDARKSIDRIFAGK